MKRESVIELIGEATGGAVTELELDQADGGLLRAGVDSLALLSLVEAIEVQHGIIIDAGEFASVFNTVDSITEFISSQLDTVNS